MTINGFLQTLKADTIDYWHVYYNNKKIKDYTQYSKKRAIIFKLEKIKSNDTLKIKYFRDTPCQDCDTYLVIEDGKHNLILTIKGKGTFNPISFSLNKLVAFKRKSNNDSFEIYYFETTTKSRTPKIQLFQIKLQ